ERGVAFAGDAARDVLDVVVQPERLLDHEDRGSAPSIFRASDIRGHPACGLDHLGVHIHRGVLLPGLDAAPDIGGPLRLSTPYAVECAGVDYSAQRVIA